MRVLKKWLFVFLCKTFLTIVTSQTPVQTETSAGTIEGYIETVEGISVEVYRGIPYAEPPVGDLRFRPPVKKKPWDGVLETKIQKYICMQGNSDALPQFPGDDRWTPTTEQNEDCLTLNVWNPQNKTENLSVMVFIHGGSFVRGTSTLDMFDGATLAAFGKVIVVTLNYRVGVFGFLYYDLKAASGNQGLKDQKMAIEWVKENIGNFGGDNSSITLFGQSSGGSSVTAHILSPISRELFQRAISLSGTINAPGLWLSKRESKKYARAIIETLDCKKRNKYKSVKCLKQVNAATLALVQLSLYSGPVLAFAPTVDGDFLPDTPMNMLAAGDHGDQDILIGNVKDEGTYILPGDPRRIFNDQYVIPLPRPNLHDLYDELTAALGEEQRSAVKYEYTDWSAVISLNNQLLLADAIGDRTFTCPSVDFAKNFNKKNNKVYYYYFTQRTSSLLWGEWMGVVHRAELEYLFGHPRDLNKNYTDAERTLSATVMKYFTDFAKHGNPTPTTNTWPLYTAANPEYEYMILNAEEQGTGKGPRPKQCMLWNWLIPSLERKHKKNS